MHPSVKTLLSEINEFRDRHDMNATAFGLGALNDGKFLFDLESGRTPSLVTIDKVRAFMRRRDRVAA